MEIYVRLVALVLVFLAAPSTLLSDERFRLDVPEGLDLYLPVPEDNLLTAEKIKLGHRLFFDRALSRDRSTACNTCHQPEHAFTVPERFARGVRSQRTKRNPPALLNRVYGRSFFWDGRVRTLEEQVLKPIQNPKEMDLTLEELEGRLKADERYANSFEHVFGREPHREDVARALATYVRSILAGDSPYDRYLLGHHQTLSAAARQGLKLFLGKANCWVCHSGPNLTDERFHNTGVAWRDGELQDEGRHAVTKRETDKGSFKTPTLRQVSQTAPYMHDGSLATLAELVDRYNRGGVPNPFLDREIRPLKLSDQEKKDLVAFLESLTGNIRFGKPEEQQTPLTPPHRVREEGR